MSDDQVDEFYVGYQPVAPPGIAKTLRRVSAALLFGILLLAVVLTLGQQRLPASFFEYGQRRDFEGVVRERPIAMLIVDRPRGALSAASESRYTFVGEGKHGAVSEVAGFEGRHVRLRGSLIYRDGITMIELASGTVVVIPSPSETTPPLKRDWLGVQTLAGEIVDSKCYLGVMNPGSRTPHRECAVRCISGGVPALFVVENFEGEKAALWLTTPDGGAVGRQVLDLIARPVEITGEVTREGDQLYLRADPRAYRALARGVEPLRH